MKKFVKRQWIQPALTMIPLIVSTIYYLPVNPICCSLLLYPCFAGCLFAGMRKARESLDVCLFKCLSASGKHQIFCSDFTMGRERIILGFYIHKDNNIFNRFARSLL